MSVTYSVRYRAVGTETWSAPIVVTSKSATLTGLTAGVRYELEITASGPGGVSSPATAARTTKTLAPAQPSSSGVLAETATVSWSAVTGASSYRVLRDGVLVGTTSSTSLPVSGLAESSTYSFTVAAVNEDGDVSNVSTARSVATAALATGGTVSNITVGGVAYRVHTFSSAGTSDFVLNAARTVEHLIVGGGGGGGGGGNNNNSSVGGFGGGGGGGGAGQVVSGSASRVASTYTVVVGAGGVGGNAGTAMNWMGGAGARGDSSSVFGATAVRGTGGNGGGNWWNNQVEYTNGSTTGSTWIDGAGGGGGKSGAGFTGGDVPYLTIGARIGGQGASSTANGWNTNYGVVAGTTSSISGSSVRYGDGGGGGGERNSGMDGIRSDAAGSGGGGGEGLQPGLAGRNGIVILRYPV